MHLRLTPNSILVPCVLVLTFLGCQRRGEIVRPLASPSEPPLGELVVANGALMIAGYAGDLGSVVLRRATHGGLIIAEVGAVTEMAAPDTVNAAGLFIHTGTTFVLPEAVRAGSPGVLLLRAGSSPGDSIIFSIGFTGEPYVRRFSRGDNRPTQAAHPAVGCYSVVRAEWDDPAAATSLRRVSVPETVRLHWQYAGLLGREQLLVATDASGRVPGELTTYYFWQAGPGDSVSVAFGTGFQTASFRLVVEGEHLVGIVRKTGDTTPGPRATAPVALRRRPCT